MIKKCIIIYSFYYTYLNDYNNNYNNNSGIPLFLKKYGILFSFQKYDIHFFPM